MYVVLLSLCSASFWWGTFAQTTGLCMVRGVKEAISGAPMLIVAIVFSGSLAWVFMALGTAVEGRAYPLLLAESVFCLVVFCLVAGAAINSGCGVSTVSRLARGEVVMLATILGWFVVWLLFAPVLLTELKGSRLVLSDFSRYTFLGIISFIIVVSCYYMNG